MQAKAQGVILLGVPTGSMNPEGSLVIPGTEQGIFAPGEPDSPDHPIYDRFFNIERSGRFFIASRDDVAIKLTARYGEDAASNILARGWAYIEEDQWLKLGLPLDTMTPGSHEFKVVEDNSATIN